jgi:hypothetical protein
MVIDRHTPIPMDKNWEQRQHAVRGIGGNRNVPALAVGRRLALLKVEEKDVRRPENRCG